MNRDRGIPSMQVLVDSIAMTPRETLGLCCVHIAQLMTHSAIYTIPFTLHLCYRPLGILQGVTKSQKVYVLSHDGLQIITNHKIQYNIANFTISYQYFFYKNTINFVWNVKRCLWKMTTNVSNKFC